MRLPPSIGAAALLTSLAACSNVSRFDVPQYPEGPSVNSIVKEVRCELAALVDDNYIDRLSIEEGDFIVGIQLNLDVTDDGNLAPTFVYTNGLFSFNAGAKLDLSREQNFTERLYFDLRQLKDTVQKEQANLHVHPNAVYGYSCPDIVDTNLAGDLGIVPSVNTALATKDLNLDQKLSGTDGAFGGYVNFVATKNLNAVGPTFTLKHFKGPGSLAGVSEVNTDKLTFAFAERNAGVTSIVKGGKKAAKGGKVVLPISTTTKVDAILDTIQQNDISNQLSGIRANLQ